MAQIHSVRHARLRPQRWMLLNTRRGIVMRLKRPMIIAAAVIISAALVGAVLVGPLGVFAHSGSDREGQQRIEHVVVIFQENVSFDHYFGAYPHATNPAGEPSF